MSEALKFAIRHHAPDGWTLSEWVPGGWFKRSRWKVIAVAGTEADIKDALRRHSMPHRETVKYYDEYGGEDCGGGW